uniref:Cytosolic arginine sensor for mTORC1 subunit 1 n=1 Tax=Nothobranchius pienaari TaxID=704102 RepID=A0A1A8MAI9_9TELE
MDLHILDHRLRVTCISKNGLVNFTHALIKLIFLRNRTRCKFFSLTETPENYTVVLDEEGFKELQPSEHLQVESSTWLPLNVVSNGNISSSSQAVGVTKIAKSVIAPLAQQHVSVFMLSTYQTDFILLKAFAGRWDSFPADLLFTSSSRELWRMVRIGGQPLGFDECGIVAQISQPLADGDISAYYISTFSFDHALVPEEDIVSVTGMLQQRKDAATS